MGMEVRALMLYPTSMHLRRHACMHACMQPVTYPGDWVRIGDARGRLSGHDAT
jgi:hypothetical protein